MNPVSSTEPRREENAQILALFQRFADDYLADLDDRPVRAQGADSAADKLVTRLPEEGDGAAAAISALIAEGLPAAIHSTGPRFFHFVIGGVTPAALGADLVAALIDQNPGLWAASPLGSQLDQVSISWLLDLFELPSTWGGTLTSGATMANFVALAAARDWWARQHGAERVDETGLAGLPEVPVLASGYIHPSDVKVLGMLGMGRSTVRRFSRDAVGRLDIEAMEAALDALGGAPAILVCSSGEVNAGDFDPLPAMADLAERYNAWLHVDGAFGLFARLSPRTRGFTEGIERADSVISDGHKWLNVPYDSGFVFLKDPSVLPGIFGSTAAYLARTDDPRPQLNFIGPESSQRARALTVWTTLRAYGRSGYRAMVERHLDLAQRVARHVDDHPHLERLAEVPLNIVCFRYRPPGVPEEELNHLNATLGAAVLEDGRVFVGTTDYGGRTAFRPAIVNWRTEEKDVDLLIKVVADLGARLLEGS